MQSLTPCCFHTNSLEVAGTSSLLLRLHPLGCWPCLSLSTCSQSPPRPSFGECSQHLGTGGCLGCDVFSGTIFVATWHWNHVPGSPALILLATGLPSWHPCYYWGFQTLELLLHAPPAGPWLAFKAKATKPRSELSGSFSLLSFPYWAKNFESR